MLKINCDPQSKNCLICDSNRIHNFEAKAFDSETSDIVNIVECRDCSFAWQYPLGRTEEHSVQYFEAAYTDKGNMTINYFNEDRKREIAKLEFDFVATLPVTNKKILDIGAGAGIFAEVAAKNNWAVTAVDPAIDLDRLNNNLNIKAIKGTTEQIPNGKLFDVVTLWDVIEHVTDPIKLIYDAKRHLKVGGWLILETGNYKSTDRVNGGKSHWIYQLDHRWYFSPTSLEKLLIDAELSSFIYSDKVLRPGWNGNSDYVRPSIVHLLKSAIKNPMQLPVQLSKYFYLIQAKDWKMPGIEIFTVAARKPSS